MADAPKRRSIASARVSSKATHWTTIATESAKNSKAGLAVVPSLLSWVKDGAGKPTGDERNLFMAAVAFAYGVWENYVEQLAIELVQHLSQELRPEAVPDDARMDFTKNRDAWAISVSPGWKQLWRDRVRDIALGDESEKFGLNTANVGQVAGLFRLVGVDPFLRADPALVARIGELVKLRGEIVHTSKVPTTLRKQHAIEWGTFVGDLIAAVDLSCRTQCSTLLAR